MIKGFKKFVFTFLIFFLFVFIADAQIVKPGITLGVNGIYAMPKGWFKDSYKFGLGGELYAGVGLGKTFLLATVGYRSFKEEVSFNAETLTYIPVKLGIKQMLLLKKAFIQADLGAATVKYEGTSSRAFTADVGAGVRVVGLEFGLYYEAFKAKNFDKYANALNAKVGYSFSL